MTSEALIERFGLPIKGFSNPIKWSDGVGFSLIQEHDSNFASLYKVGFGNLNPENNLNDLWVSVSYGKKISDGISIGTGKNGLRNPIDLDFHNEFYYDQNTDTFFHRNKIIEPKKIILDIARLHKLPTRPLAGLLLRLRLGVWRIVIPGIIGGLDWFLTRSLWFISGEKTNGDIMKRLVTERLERIDERIRRRAPQLDEPTFSKGKPLTFFGYEAKRWSVVFYCSVHLLIYIVLFLSKTHSKLLSQIFMSNFFSLCYVVITFTITEAGVPRFLRFCIKKTVKLYGDVVFKTVKISTSTLFSC